MIRHLFFVCFFVSSIFGLAQEYSFDSYSTNSGLSQSQVYDIEQDKEGYLWIATEGGLNRFDGNRFRIFTTSDGLAKDAIRCIYLSEDDTKYFGSIGAITSMKSEKVNRYYFVDSSSIRINCIAEFHDTLFVGTNGKGVFYLDQNVLKPYPSTALLNKNKIRSLKKIRNQLFIGTNKGLGILSESNSIRFLQKGENPDFFLSIGEVKSINERIFIGTYNHGIYEFVNDDLKKLPFINDENVIRNFVLTENSIYCIEKSSFIKYDLNTQKEDFRIFTDNGLPEADLLTSFIDRENNVWIGTSGKGLCRFIGETFVSYTTKEGLSSSQVMSVKKREHFYYFGTFNNGLTIWDEETGRTEIWNEENGLTSNIVWDVCASDLNHVLIGTENGLVLLKDGKLNLLTQSIYGEDYRVRSICDLGDDRFLIGGNEGLLFLNKGKIGKYFRNDSIPYYIKQIKKGPDGKIWVASLNGLYYFDDSGLHKFSFQQELIEINSIDFFDEGAVVLGTETGVYIIEENRLIPLKIDLRRSSRQINLVVCSGKNQLYFGTNSGIFMGNLSEDLKSLKNFKHFSAKDGLPGSEVNINSGMLSDNNLWFGTEEALVRLNLNKIFELEDLVAPNVVISNLEIFMEGKELADFSKGIDENGLPIELELPYRFNYFSIEFKGLSFKNNGDILYQYKLEGLNDKWTPLVENNVATFTSLAPGAYTFKVRVMNKSGIVSEIKEFSFLVLPPFYLTWWFILLSIILLIGFVTLIIQVRTRAVKQRKDNENLVYKSKLLQLEQQSLNASMNRHFIFNSLNSIQYFINVSDKISANKYLTNFAKLIRKNLDSTTNENNMVVLSDEINRLELYLSLENMRFSGKFDYDISIEAGVDVEMILVPSMMLQPFVENSIIHGILPKKEKGKIEIKVYVKEGFTVFEIADDGIGIKKSQELKKNYNSEHDSKGMEITANRVDILKRILLKDLKISGPHETYNQEGKITGTNVKIYLKLN